MLLAVLQYVGVVTWGDRLGKFVGSVYVASTTSFILALGGRSGLLSTFV